MIDSHWATAEILRAYGERQLALGQAAPARALFARALAIAEAQGSWLWALRAATSLARLAPTDEASRSLTAALRRVQGGERSADLRAARTLMNTSIG